MNANITIPIFGGLIATPNLIVAIYFHLKYFSSKKWIQVPGVITSSEVKSVHNAGCAPKVTYTYSFEHHKYSGDRIWLTSWSQPSIKLSQNVANRYPVNSSVMVYCNPKQPSDSILERKFTIGILGCYFAALVGFSCVFLPLFIDLE
ncbi:MAG: DUF3592 domain-containing protein [Planctomycetes bacterium]|nr:DUF3592 domain-containing protein [Planctomycetota bacterium]